MKKKISGKKDDLLAGWDVRSLPKTERLAVVTDDMELAEDLERRLNVLLKDGYKIYHRHEVTSGVALFILERDVDG